jgi:sulfite exporter TauE/SafE
MIEVLAPAFVMGLLGGAHCVAMCGSASSALCSSSSSPRRLGLAYNAGRLVGYSVLGALVGALGALPPGGALDAVRYGLRVLAVVTMLSVGLHLLGLPSIVARLEALGGPLWRRITPLTRRLLPLRSVGGALAAGAVWALMPCGLLYGALALAATTSSALAGASTMAAFALGTMPVMLLVALVARRTVAVLGRLAPRRIAGVVVLAFGLWNMAGVAQQVGLASHPHACCPRR